MLGGHTEVPWGQSHWEGVRCSPHSERPSGQESSCLPAGVMGSGGCFPGAQQPQTPEGTCVWGFSRTMRNPRSVQAPGPAPWVLPQHPEGLCLCAQPRRPSEDQQIQGRASCHSCCGEATPSTAHPEDWTLGLVGSGERPLAMRWGWASLGPLTGQRPPGWSSGGHRQSKA